jgi:hypothetical protein
MTREQTITYTVGTIVRARARQLLDPGRRWEEGVAVGLLWAYLAEHLASEGVGDAPHPGAVAFVKVATVDNKPLWYSEIEERVRTFLDSV